jgi:hypothetical protein
MRQYQKTNMYNTCSPVSKRAEGYSVTVQAVNNKLTRQWHCEWITSTVSWLCAPFEEQHCRFNEERSHYKTAARRMWSIRQLSQVQCLTPPAILPLKSFINRRQATTHTHTHTHIYAQNSVALSPQVNCTDWSTATCRRNLMPTFVDRGVSRGQRGGSPADVNTHTHTKLKYYFYSSGLGRQL